MMATIPPEERVTYRQLEEGAVVEDGDGHVYDLLGFTPTPFNTATEFREMRVRRRAEPGKEPVERSVWVKSLTATCRLVKEGGRA